MNTKEDKSKEEETKKNEGKKRSTESGDIGNKRYVSVGQYPDFVSLAAPAIASINNPFYLGGDIILNPELSDYLTTQRTQELEDEIVKLKKEINEQLKAKEKIDKLNDKIAELEKKQRLQHLLLRVNEKARKILLESDEFRNLFDKEYCDAVIMSVDIRRSTELMLKAREPKLFAKFITTLCLDLLASTIMNNYGIFDKFTGDGILAFFPTFYSGEDASYWALKAADECHKHFSKHYENNRASFNSILLDVGLGIGIDYGSTHMIQVQSGITVIGTPVVYACRLSGAKGGQTLLNQPAYEETSKKFGEYISFNETELEVKHEGKMLAYQATITKRNYQPKEPTWLTELNKK